MKRLFKNKHTFRASPRGQGLMETIVAFTIIGLGMLGSFSLVLSTLGQSGELQSSMIGSQLAWEGVEVVRNIRDSNWLSQSPWDTGMSGIADTTAIPAFDPEAGSWTLDFAPSGFSDAAAVVYRDQGVYRQSTAGATGNATVFRRLITIDPEGTDFRKKITSEVRWTEKGKERSVMAIGELYHWR
ncbi:MAG: hypothetical protein HY453_00355 [Parcubacteria group bacterium]|nr:hypothetical protein [Parcubacteria group bacterium]